MNRTEDTQDTRPEKTTTQRGTSALITVFWLGIAVAIGGTVAGLIADDNAILRALLVPGILVSMICWSKLRAANGHADTAPAEELDEYERSVLSTWRKRALSAYTMLTGIGGMAFLLTGSLRDAPGSTALIAAGYFMLFTSLIVYPLPMIGYAITFNRKED